MRTFRRIPLLAAWLAWDLVLLQFVQIPYRPNFSLSIPVARALFALVVVRYRMGNFQSTQNVETVKNTRYVEPHQRNTA